VRCEQRTAAQVVPTAQRPGLVATVDDEFYLLVVEIGMVDELLEGGAIEVEASGGELWRDPYPVGHVVGESVDFAELLRVDKASETFSITDDGAGIRFAYAGDASEIGRVGTVVLGEARVGNAAQVRVKDAYGQQHYVMVEPDSEDVLKQGDAVLLVSLNGNTFKAILNPSGNLVD